MRASARFPIAVQTVTMIAALSDECKVNSDIIAKSTGVNAAQIRKIFQSLKQAGIIAVSPGTGGATLARSPNNITLYGLFSAVESPKLEDIFKFPQNLSENFPNGGNAYGVLKAHLADSVQIPYEHFNVITVSMLLKELETVDFKKSILDDRA